MPCAQRMRFCRYLSRPVACSMSNAMSPEAKDMLLVCRLRCAQLPRLVQPAASAWQQQGISS